MHAPKARGEERSALNRGAGDGDGEVPPTVGGTTPGVDSAHLQEGGGAVGGGIALGGSMHAPKAGVEERSALDRGAGEGGGQAQGGEEIEGGCVEQGSLKVYNGPRKGEGEGEDREMLSPPAEGEGEEEGDVPLGGMIHAGRLEEREFDAPKVALKREGGGGDAGGAGGAVSHERGTPVPATAGEGGVQNGSWEDVGEGEGEGAAVGADGVLSALAGQLLDGRQRSPPNPRTLDPIPSTHNSQPEALNPKHSTLDPGPWTLDHELISQQSKPSSLTSHPFTPNPNPSTRRYKPKTVHPNETPLK